MVRRGTDVLRPAYGGTVRVAIIGFGRAGRQHVEAINRAGNVSLHSVLESSENVDVSPHLRAPSWAAVLDDPAIDAVALCVPPDRHAPLATEALAAGKAVLLEKPPTTSVAELDDVIAAGGVAAVMLQHRFRIPAEAPADWNGRSAATLLVSRPRDTEHYTGWRGDPAQAFGGITAHLGVHYLDIACQLLGEVERVEIGDHRECAPGIDVRVSGTVVFRSGATLAFCVAADAGARLEQLVVLGEGGRRFEVTDGVTTVHDGQGGVGRRSAATATALDLRTRVYEEFAAGPRLSALSRARPALVVLEEIRRAGSPAEAVAR
ncbi:Gfo/Idh/MocA family oxidoreductase [Spongiactinospora sp. TRM90649]|uniref:Gfo/Idh/MocA family protein n=1 Tax=Spongiactinospora sp. TRM90649 TaxID=3031114 RepID=UPI0023F739C3|nr:Gfo/Idh/MocA family oxidoreductase [Spongiactinospora sp. TRM90649]MDF5757691.1 Gfo/Idh/MocA family oxidoreductase [Spongiactinospora sp. TRM90649]